MKSFKDQILEWLKDDSDAFCDTSQTKMQSNFQVQEALEGEKSFSPSTDFFSKTQFFLDDDIKIFSATEAEINYWHAFGGLCFLQDLLREYNLDYGNAAYDKYKIGYNEQEHAATFALDETHYYKIPFTSANGEVLDKDFADKVLRKIKSQVKAK